MINHTPFIKENFRWDGMYLTYVTDPVTWAPGSRVFIARFKYSKRDRASFQKFLMKNFTVKEYLDAAKTSTPVAILKSKGWVSPTVERNSDWLRERVLDNAY